MREAVSGLSFQPLYRQAIDLIVRRIARGDWKPGMLLPSEPKLAHELGVSVGTIRKALHQLVQDQLVERRQGVGTFVAAATREQSLFRFFKLIDRGGARVMPDCDEVSRESRVADARERARLALGTGARVVRVERLRMLQGRVMMTDLVVLPLGRFRGLLEVAGPLPPTLYDFYESRFGVTVLRVEERLGAVLADEVDADRLGVTAGAAVLEIDRIAYSFDDEAVELRRSRLPGGAYFYLSELS